MLSIRWLQTGLILIILLAAWVYWYVQKKGFQNAVMDLNSLLGRYGNYYNRIRHSYLLSVLLAEDDVTNRKVATRMLEKLGCRVDLVINGKEAVEKVERASYDLVFMDCQMPEMDGYEATAKIRGYTGKTAGTPIVAMTAHATTADRQKCLEVGMDDYISKPVKQKDLRAVLEKWRRAAGNRSHLKQNSELLQPQSTQVTETKTTPPLDPLSLANLYEIAEGDASFLKELFETFISDASENIGLMRQAVDEEDASGLQKTAHTLKGSSSSVGAQVMADICKRLESIGDSGASLEATALIEQLVAEFSHVEVALEAELQGKRE